MKRKLVTMTLTVSVPAEMSAAHARREVRCLVRDGAGYFTSPGYPDSVKVRRIGPARAALATTEPAGGEA